MKTHLFGTDIKPRYMRTTLPSIRAQVVNGRRIQPLDGMDWIIFGVAK